MLCAIGVGCAAMNVQKPTAAVTGMAVKGVDANGFTLNFDVEIHNPNSMALPLAAADYKLGLGGVDVVEGKARPQGSIPAGSSKSVALPVTLTYENLLAAERSIVKSGGNVPYALDAGLSIDTGSPLLGKLRVPLQYQGNAAAQTNPEQPVGHHAKPRRAEAREGIAGRLVQPLVG